MWLFMFLLTFIVIVGSAYFVGWVTYLVFKRGCEDYDRFKHFIGNRAGARYCPTCGNELVDGHCSWCAS